MLLDPDVGGLIGVAAMTVSSTTVRKSYITLRGLNLGREFMKQNDLQPEQQYSMIIDGLEDGETEGTLNKSGFIGGLAKLYHSFQLKDGDEVGLEYDGSVLRIMPPGIAQRVDPQVVADVADSAGVFATQVLRHIHIDPFEPGNLTRWSPQTEPDVYLVFGILNEYTDYRYCCGASKELLSRLGYKSETKPDAILIDRNSGQYMMAEFKVRSSDFASNHQAEDVDLLVCWIDNQADRSVLPREVLALKSLLEKVVREGDIDL